VKEGCVTLDIDPSDTDRRCKEAFEVFRADKKFYVKKTPGKFNLPRRQSRERDVNLAMNNYVMYMSIFFL
jgi:hypothetical protein